MPVPDTDFDLFARNMLPPDQRLPGIEIFASASVSQMTRLYNIFVDYMNGSGALEWSSSTTYAKGWQAKTVNGVYESLQDDNLNNLVTDTNYWLKILDSFIGAKERVKYNGRYLNLTFQLNRQFQSQLTANGYVGFRQPPYPAPYDFGLGGGTWSDIYITTDVPAYTSFGVTDIPQASGAISSLPTSVGITDVAIITAANTYKYTVHIPLSVFNALGSTDSIRESIIRKFIDKYNPIGLGYSIQTY